MKPDSGGMATIRMYRDFKTVSEGLRAAMVVIVLRVYFVGPSNRPSARGRRDARELNAPLRCRAASQLVGDFVGSHIFLQPDGASASQVHRHHYLFSSFLS